MKRIAFYFTDGLMSGLGRGALIALYWNWFVRDHLFTTAPTMSVWVGWALSWLGVLLTVVALPSTDIDEVEQTILKWGLYIGGAVTAVVLHWIVIT